MSLINRLPVGRASRRQDKNQRSYFWNRKCRPYRMEFPFLVSGNPDYHDDYDQLRYLTMCVQLSQTWTADGGLYWIRTSDPYSVKVML